jgi:PAS domain S-box-containing protein
MKLKNQVIWILVLTIVVLVISTSLISNNFLLHQISGFEDNNARQSMTSLTQSLLDRVQSERSTAIEWSNWDDSYVFVETLDPGYINSVLVDETFQTGNLNLVLFINRSGDIVYSKGYDTVNRTRTAIPAGFLQNLEAHGIFNGGTDPDFRGNAGILVFRDMIMLVSAEPILTSTGEGPPHGVLVRASYLDPDLIAGKFGLSPGSFRILSEDTDTPPLQSNGPSLANLADSYQVNILATTDTLLVTAPIDDFYGQPLRLELALQRTIYQQGVETLTLVVIAIILLGVLSGSILIAFFTRSVIQPLDRLRLEAQEIGESKNFSRRVTLPARNEFRQLGSSINNMLQSLENAARERLSSERKYHDLFVSSHEGIVLTDLDGKILDANESFLAMNGSSSPGDLTPRSFFSLFDPRCATQIRMMVSEKCEAKNRTAGELECVLESSRTSPVPVSLTCWPMSDSVGIWKGVWWLVKDIRERKEMEQVKREALVQINKNIEQIAILNDEIRNPLAVIVGLADLSDDPLKEQIIVQTGKIDDIVTQLDRGWLESQKVKDFLKKYYGKDED